MHNTAGLVPIGEIINQIKTLEALGKTGSLYLLTRTGDGAVIVFDGGVIIDVVYKSLQGTAALPMFRRIDEAKYTFKPGQTAEVQAAASKGMTLSFAQTLYRILEQKGDGQATGAVTAPATPFQSPGKAEMAQAAANAGKKRVLVVEDSKISRLVLTRFLDDNGYLAIEAVNGQAALAQLAVDKPDLVILDLILPDIDGYAVFTAMKNDPRTRDIPIIILTSRDSLLDRLKGKMSGTDEYVTKPFKNEILLEKLDKYLR